MSKENINIELAKSWFVLAQILGVLSGLFMVAAGFLYPSPNEVSNLHNQIRDFCNDIMQDDIPPYNSSFDCRIKYGGSFIDNAVINLNVSIFLMSFSFIIALFSLLVWNLGRLKIKNKNLKDELIGIILSIIFIIFLIPIFFAFLS